MQTKVVLNNGIGDHFVFKSFLQDYINIHGNPAIYARHPEVFTCANKIRREDKSQDNVYSYMQDLNWNERFVKAYAQMFGVGSVVEKEYISGNSQSYVVISPFSFPAKTYPYWKELVSKIPFTTIQIGKTGDQVLPTTFHLFDLSFLEIEHLIKYCYTWISIDSFLPHLVNCMDRPIRGNVVFGISDPNIFGYEQNNNILKSRSYLRQNQFKNWYKIPQNSDCFDGPDTVIKLLNMV